MLEEKIMATYEEELFRYGITCVENLVHLKKVTPDQRDELILMAKSGIVPSRDVLEQVFSEAVKRIGEKTSEAVDEYFVKRHNKLIDDREGNYIKLSDEQCEMCKVRDGIVTNVRYMDDVAVYEVEYSDGKGIAIGKYFATANVGDKIRCHNHAAVKKI
ncbi:hypothetical protein GOV14_05155 [Candidatus Pacearchaeota archaeon]|nr:hypothetical protein [Candidatus Pacearchaeota archaeon]